MQPENAPMGTQVKLPERIRWARKAAGLTQKELGIEVGAGTGMAPKWELEENNMSYRCPNPETLEAISLATGIRLEWIKTGKGEPYDPKRRELAQRIHALILEQGSGQTAGFQRSGIERLVRSTGVEESVWRRWERAGPRNLQEAMILEDAIGKIKNPASNAIPTLLRTLHGEASAPVADLNSPRVIRTPRDQWVDVPLLTTWAAAGLGYENGQVETETEIRLSASHIRSVLRVPPQALYAIHVEGDSMTPILQPGDAIFIDTRAKQMGADGIYLIRQDEALMVKQLQRLPGGNIQVVSRNPAYAAYTITPDNHHGFEIVGRVVGKCGRL